VVRLGACGGGLIVAALLALPALAAEPIIGRASVTDGDTVVIHGTRIRLHGIDAPESAQLCQDAVGKDYRCGQKAALALADYIGEAPITCEPRDTDRYGRTVALCRRGLKDLNAWMVEQGYAMAYQRYSRDYVGVETTARALKRGLWAGTFDPPSDWRRAKRANGVETRPEMAKATETPSPLLRTTCTIKGNVSRSGERIYHLPQSREYARVVIDTKAGERMFCSETEAQAAGWRASRQ
jgi:endonuclease YncB( thermonuclease family)